MAITMRHTRFLLFLTGQQHEHPPLPKECRNIPQSIPPLLLPIRRAYFDES